MTLTLKCCAVRKQHGGFGAITLLLRTIKRTVPQALTELTIKEEEVSQRKANLYNPNWGCWFSVSRLMPAWAAHDRGLCLLAPSQSLRAQIENRSCVFVGRDPAAHKQDGCYGCACLFAQSESIRKSFCMHVDL